MQSITTWTFKPHEPLALAKRFSDMEGTALLYSGGHLDSAQASYLCLFPEQKITLSAQPGCWQTLQKQLANFNHHALPIPQWVGYLGYEFGCFADPDKIIPYFQPSIPDCCFYAPSVIIHFEHATQKATLYALSSSISLERLLPTAKQPGPFSLGRCSDTLQSYLEKIAQAKEWILDGEIYQVNLSQQIELEGNSSAFDHYEQVVGLNPAPFTAYIQCGSFAVVSSSPERFLCKKGNTLQTRPIKGTAPRGKSKEEDENIRKQLLSSEKERAELLMITDLMRSDLGKICLAGTVKTQGIWRCEAYTNVFHLLSIIEGIVDPYRHPVDMIQPLFPGGSITGCPKLRAMEAIAALEQRPRGIYTGSIGYFAANGDFDFNIAIRTLIVHPESIQLQLGGAIVIDSDPVKEYEETLHKGYSLFSILGMKEFIIS